MDVFLNLRRMSLHFWNLFFIISSSPACSLTTVILFSLTIFVIFTANLGQRSTKPLSTWKAPKPLSLFFSPVACWYNISTNHKARLQHVVWMSSTSGATGNCLGVWMDNFRLLSFFVLIFFGVCKMGNQKFKSRSDRICNCSCLSLSRSRSLSFSFSLSVRLSQAEIDVWNIEGFLEPDIRVTDS